MSLTIIVILIVAGIILLIIELLVIPGITIAGIGGLLMMAIAIYFAYKSHGNSIGNYFLIGSLFIGFFAVILSLRTKTWKNVGLQSSIDSKVESYQSEKVHVGDEGITISRLAPIGKVMVNDIICEAKSHFDFIDENTEITVIKVNKSQIIVKPKKLS